MANNSDKELRARHVEALLNGRRIRAGVSNRRTLTKLLRSMPVIGDRNRRAWRQLQRHKAFWLRVSHGDRARLLFVDGGGWTTIEGRTMHVSRVLKSERPDGLLT